MKTFNQIWIRDPCNHRGILSRVPLVVCSCSSSAAATLSAHCPADALELSMATRTASRDCEGQSEPINGTMLRDEKKKENKIRIKSQITLLVTFIPALPKMSLRVCFMFACFPLFIIVLLFMQACDDCLLSVYRMYRGEEHECLFFLFLRTLTDFLTTMLLLPCKAKALKGI